MFWVNGLQFLLEYQFDENDPQKGDERLLEITYDWAFHNILQNFKNRKVSLTSLFYCDKTYQVRNESVIYIMTKNESGEEFISSPFELSIICNTLKPTSLC